MKLKCMALAACIAAALPAGVSAATAKPDPLVDCGNPDPDISIEACTSALASPAQPPGVYAVNYSNRAAAYMKKKQYDEAMADLKRASNLAPDEGLIYQNIAVLYFRQKDYDRALVYINKTLKTYPTLSYGLLGRGAIFMRKHDYAQAIRDYDRVIQRYPKWDAGYGARCFARAELGQDLHGALEDCETALRLKPGDPSYLADRADAEYRLGETDKALADCTAALAKAPNTSAALYVRGLIKRDRGDPQGGKADMDAAGSVDADVHINALSVDLK